MTKEIDKRIIKKEFNTGHEVDTVTIQESDYVSLKEQAETLVKCAKRNEELENVIVKLDGFADTTVDKNHILNTKIHKALEVCQAFKEGQIGDMNDSFLVDEIIDILI